MAVVCKPLNQQLSMGCQWKDNIHIFHLVPSSTLCDHYFGHKKLLKSQTEVIISKNAHICPCNYEGVYDRWKESGNYRPIEHTNGDV